MPDPAAQSAPLPPMEGPTVGQVECDRYCDHCGFNLRTQAVVRDTRTGLLLARCTECGGVIAAATATSASRVWMQRLGVLAVVLWVLFILWATFMLGVVETAMQAVTLDELTEGTRSGRVIRDDVEDAWAFLSLVLSVSAGAGFAMMTLHACAAHHWKKAAHTAMAVVVPMAPMVFAWRAWVHEAPDLEAWAWPYLLSHYGVQAGAGVLGALFGRPLGRTVSRLLLPPRTRQVLAFLWLADGLPPPPMMNMMKKPSREPASIG